MHCLMNEFWDVNKRHTQKAVTESNWQLEAQHYFPVFSQRHFSWPHFQSVQRVSGPRWEQQPLLFSNMPNIKQQSVKNNCKNCKILFFFFFSSDQAPSMGFTTYKVISYFSLETWIISLAPAQQPFYWRTFYIHRYCQKIQTWARETLILKQCVWVMNVIRVKCKLNNLCFSYKALCY